MKFGMARAELPPRIGYWSAQYIKWGHNPDGTLKDKQKFDHDVTLCKDEANQVDYTSLFCTDVFNNTIKGSFLDPYFWYTEVNLKKCDGTKNVTCADEKEIDDFFVKYARLSLPYQDSFIDLSGTGEVF